MIVKMKKVSLITIAARSRETLLALRKLGVLHVEKTIAENLGLSSLYERRKTIDRVLNTLAAQKTRKKTGGATDELIDTDALIVRVMNGTQTIARLYEEIDQLIKIKDRVSAWGNFNPHDLTDLASRGAALHLFEVQKSDLKKIPDDVDFLVIERGKISVLIAVVDGLQAVPQTWTEIVVPDKSLDSIVDDIRAKRSEIDERQNELVELARFTDRVKARKGELEREIDFEEVKTGMGTATGLEYLKGYVPVHLVDKLCKLAHDEGWGLVIDDPGPDDRVPTLLKNNPLVALIQPVYDLFDIRPGYNEHDISLWFLLFFSVFFAMLIGDAGYGMIIVLLTIAARLALKKAPAAPFLLMLILGVCTVVWGAITGMWFGLVEIAHHPGFSWMIVPQLASFPPPGSLSHDTGKLIIDICFTIAVVHLSIAHLVNIKRLFPSLKVGGELGKLAVVWGMYFLVESILLNKPSYPFIIWLILGGFLFIFLFSEQEGHFGKGILKSLAGILPMLLNIISVFGDIVSYFRIYAVGLAGFQIAGSFTQIARMIGWNSVITGFAATLILVAVHILNIVLGGLSVVVHGIRLNLLEFSGHLGLEWSGFAYRPFSEE